MNKINLLIEHITNRKVYTFAVFFLTAFLCYFNVLKGPFVLDDEHFIQKNKYVHDFKIKKIYTSSVTEGAGFASNFYRPNQQLIYAVIYKFFKDNTVPYHFFSILVHALNTYLIFLMLKLLFFDSLSAFCSALIYLVHPIHTESISFISGLAGPLGTLFLLIGILIWIRSLCFKKVIKEELYLAATLVCFVVALFTKENMVVLLPLSVVISAYLWDSLRKRSRMYCLISIVVFAFLTAGYLYLKFKYFSFTGNLGLTGEDNIYTARLSVRLMTFVSVLWEYCLMIFVPIRLNYEKSYTAFVSLFTWRGAFGIFFMVCAFVSFVFRKRYKKVFLGVCWFFAAMIPFMGILPLNSMYLEHWLYIPLIGIVMIFGAWLQRAIVHKKYRTIGFIMAVLLGMCAGRTLARNSQWADIEKFYVNELKYCEHSVRVYNNLAMYYSDNNQLEKAEEYYKKAIKEGAPAPEPYHNLAMVYLNQNKIEKAVDALIQALKINPKFTFSSRLLYQIYYKSRMYDKAASVRRTYGLE